MMTVLSGLLGVSYQELNVLLFVVIHPIITISFMIGYVKYKRKYNESKNIRNSRSQE